MCEAHDMQDSLKIGVLGEEIIYSYIKSMDKVYYIDDVRHNLKYRKLDIDFIVKMDNMKEFSVEIKTDNSTCSNIFYETFSCLETNSVGCMKKTKAQYIFYFFLRTKELYILETKKLNEWFDRNISIFKEKNFKNKRYKRNINDEDSYYTSSGFVIPKQYLEENFRYYKKYILQ